MRKLLYLLPLLSALLFSCKSDEQKASEAIESYLKENVEGFQSYTPTKTSLVEAKNTVFNNKECNEIANKIVAISLGNAMGVSELNGVDVQSELVKLKNALDYQVANLDTAEVIGWEVKLTYDLTTSNGNKNDVEGRYIINKELNKVIYAEETPDFGMFTNMATSTKQMLLESAVKRNR